MERSDALRMGAVLAIVQAILVSSPAPAADPVGSAGPAPASPGGWDQTPLRGQMDGDKAPQPTPLAAPSSPAASGGQPSSSGKAPESANPAAAAVPSPVAKKIRKDFRIAYRMAGDPWLYKTAAADPSVLEAICEHPWAAARLAKNRHLGDLAEADHYLCRRLTRWWLASRWLVQSPEADRVIALDPEGIYWAINRNPGLAYSLAKNIEFNQMINENPDLGKFIGQHM